MDAYNYIKDNVPRETFQKFEIYVSCLVKWHRKVNLVSRETIEKVWERHILDSLQLSLILQHKNDKIIDIGSGAGFPGMVLAIMNFENICLVEPNLKKTTFLKEVSRATVTPVTIYQKKIEKITLQDISTIVSRAFTSLKKLFEVSHPFLKEETSCIFLKGQNWKQEVDEAYAEWCFEYETVPSMTSPRSQIIIAKKIFKRNEL